MYTLLTCSCSTSLFSWSSACLTGDIQFCRHPCNTCWELRWSAQHCAQHLKARTYGTDETARDAHVDHAALCTQQNSVCTGRQLSSIILCSKCYLKRSNTFLVDCFKLLFQHTRYFMLGSHLLTRIHEQVIIHEGISYLLMNVCYVYEQWRNGRSGGVYLWWVS